MKTIILLILLLLFGCDITENNESHGRKTRDTGGRVVK